MLCVPFEVADKIWSVFEVFSFFFSSFSDLFESDSSLGDVLFLRDCVSLRVFCDGPFVFEKIVDPADGDSPFSVAFSVLSAFWEVDEAESLELCDVAVVRV